MKKYLIVLVTSIFIMGCSRQTGKKEILAKVNNYEITQEEFRAEFVESAYSLNNTYESRKEFLDNLINRKLILQDAQRKGLDKDKSFLKMIERFWEQSLLKLTLERKSKELISKVQISDKEIEGEYQKMLKDGKTDKPLEAMYSQIKWEITRAKGTQLMNEWVLQLNEGQEIKINYDLLKGE